MKKVMIEKLNELKNTSKLLDYAIDYYTDRIEQNDMSIKDLQNDMKDIMSLGCNNCSMMWLLEYNDTNEFFEEYKDEINKYLTEKMKEKNKNIFDLLGDKSKEIIEDPLYETQNSKFLLSHLVFEQLTEDLYDELFENIAIDFSKELEQLKTENNSIRNFVIDFYMNSEYYGEKGTEKAFKDRIKYINENGCDDTLYTPLAYYEDIDKFWGKYEKEIYERLEQIKYLKNNKPLNEIIDGYDITDIKNEGESNKSCIANYIFKDISNNIYSRIYNTRPIYNFLEDLKGESDLKDSIINRILFNEKEDSIKQELQDIVEYGCRKEGLQGFIYDEDIEEFFDSHKNEIKSIIESSKNTMGIKDNNIDTLLNGFIKEDTNFETLQNKKIASFFVTDTIVADILDEVKQLDQEPKIQELEQ